jgi:diguanylate cyclase (GGDEF)-like protein
MHAPGVLALEIGPRPAGRKRFPLVRYFSITALACMLVIAVPLGMFNQRQATESLHALAEEQNVTLTRTFSNFLWSHFAPLVSDSRGVDRQALGSDHRLAYLRSLVIDTMRDTGVVKVKIYNLDGTTVFSTDLRQIGESTAGNVGFSGAAGGTVVSGLAHRDRFDAFDGVISDRDLFSSYLPVRNESGEVVAVFELYRDVTRLVERMERTNLIQGLCIAIAIAALFALLAVIVWRAQSIIDEQGDALQASLDQVQESNRLLDERVQERTAQLTQVNRAMENEIRERREAEGQLEYLAHHDPLTGLANRLLLQERIDQAIERARCIDGRFALLYIDLDNFKGLNDTFGHPVGDMLLCTVAEDLAGNLRGSDTLARVGGDEFILVAEIEDDVHARTLADKILEILRRPHMIADVELYLSAAIGISLYPGDGSEGHTLIRNADTAMYQAKAAGRDQYRHYAESMTTQVEERLRLDALLRRAQENGELRLVYQPQVDAGTAEIVGCEALLRWHHPTLGEIPPGRFIPLAEESGYIRQLGLWVLAEACASMRRWLDCGLDMARVSVNVSARQLEDADIVGQVLAILGRIGLPAGMLELEITETAIMSNGRAIDVLGELHAAGVRLAVDDFGTGYSSLSYLKRLPIDKLKIDRSFVSNLHRDASDEAIVRSIISLARNLRLTTVAEGVELPEQAAILVAEGCDQIQGFLYSQPLSPDELMLRWAEQGQGRRQPALQALYRS